MNKNKYPFGQVPALSVGDLHIVQMDAIMRHLARELGYYENAVNVDMVVSSIEDIKMPYVRTIYGNDYVLSIYQIDL